MTLRLIKDGAIEQIAEETPQRFEEYGHLRELYSFGEVSIGSVNSGLVRALTEKSSTHELKQWTGNAQGFGIEVLLNNPTQNSETRKLQVYPISFEIEFSREGYVIENCRIAPKAIPMREATPTHVARIQSNENIMEFFREENVKDRLYLIADTFELSEDEKQAFFDILMSDAQKQIETDPTTFQAIQQAYQRDYTASVADKKNVGLIAQPFNEEETSAKKYSVIRRPDGIALLHPIE